MNRFIKIYMKDGRIFYPIFKDADLGLKTIHNILDCMKLRFLHIDTMYGERLLPINEISFVGIYEQDGD